MQTISANRLVRRKSKQIARCPRGKKEQNHFRTFGTPADGFLKHQFLPLLEQGEQLPNQSLSEKGFFKSLSSLTGVYRLEKTTFENRPYPYNILLTHACAQEQLKKSGQDIELSIMQDDNDIITLATKHVYSTGNTLYYIPVLPLYRLLQSKRQKQTAELLLSVFAYLYHIAGIPYYRENGSYLYYQYECMEEWLLDDFQNDEIQQDNLAISEFNKASYYGDVMLRKIYNPYHLNDFKQRTEKYKANIHFEKECLIIAKKALALLLQYPDHSIFRNTNNGKFQDEDQTIKAEQYISFMADCEGQLHENIIRAVNDEFNECSEIEEPTLLQFYDEKSRPLSMGLHFEYLVFPLINDLCTLLNQTP
jgi:hypothetical protein